MSDSFAGGHGALEPQSLVQMAFHRLQADILSGALEPGERLREEQLTQKFGISRAPLREALRLLAEQGLVEHLPRRGSRVTTYSDRDFTELFAVRDALERLAVNELIAQPANTLDFTELEKTMDILTTAAESGDRLEASRAHRAFHQAVIAIPGNRQLQLTYEPVIVKLQLYMAANLRREADTASPQEGARRHRELFEAIISGDPGDIAHRLEQHGSRRYFH
ncbi:MAG: GntR family transcriptional regulator [Nocardioides sp.]